MREGRSEEGREGGKEGKLGERLLALRSAKSGNAFCKAAACKGEIVAGERSCKASFHIADSPRLPSTACRVALTLKVERLLRANALGMGVEEARRELREASYKDMSPFR